VKYSHLTDAWAHTTVKRAVNLLDKARVIKRIPSASPSGLPLGASIADRKFKAIMVDVGIWQYLSGMRIDTAISEDDLLDVHHFFLNDYFSSDTQFHGHTSIMTIRDVEKSLILTTLKEQEQNRTKTAELLGISVRTLRNKLNEYRKEGLAV
ncbi:helix-turn-helix domain-containing protein, partial [bacterium]|nr:helix-turn-helix domain-containing protein [bacterium]